MLIFRIQVITIKTLSDRLSFQELQKLHAQYRTGCEGSMV
jgi:hypothetical protein